MNKPTTTFETTQQSIDKSDVRAAIEYFKIMCEGYRKSTDGRANSCIKTILSTLTAQLDHIQERLKVGDGGLSEEHRAASLAMLERCFQIFRDREGVDVQADIREQEQAAWMLVNDYGDWIAQALKPSVYPDIVEALGEVKACLSNNANSESQTTLSLTGDSQKAFNTANVGGFYITESLDDADMYDLRKKVSEKGYRFVAEFCWTDKGLAEKAALALSPQSVDVDSLRLEKLKGHEGTCLCAGCMKVFTYNRTLDDVKALMGKGGE